MIFLMSSTAHIRALIGATLISGMGLAYAQDAPTKPAAAATPPPAQAKEQDKPKEPEKPKTIDDLTKDFTKMEGMFTLYRQTKDKKDTIYLEMPESSLDKLMLIQVTSASGLGDTSAFVFHGMPISDLPVKFHRLDENRIQLLMPNLAHRGNTFESKLGIQRSFPDAILATFDIAANQAERKSMLLDISNFFKSDIADLSTAADPWGMDPAGSRVDTVKNFPENFVIRTVYQLQRKGPANGMDPRSVPWAVSFNVSQIPENDGYRPRLGDPRVGYFTSDFEDLTDASQEFDANVSFIQRWHLEKADPTAEISEPKKPIVFYIDNAVPKEYRDDVRKGLLMYNPAFEKVGFKNAIVVKQMPEDADWDIADLRYNVARWTTGMPFAIALFRANPLTGEILNASLNMDAGFAASGTAQFDTVIDPVFAQPMGEDTTVDGQKIPAALMKKYAARLCDMQERGKLTQATGFAAAEVLTPGFTVADREALVHQYITEVVAHEMGHCLGLRHNFAASTQLTQAQMSDPTVIAQHGLGASVMDYTPYNAGALGKRGVDYYAQNIGKYDFWAIKYGYMPVDANSPEGEIPALRQVASLGSTPGYLYESDGSADDIDPYVVRFDQSRNPLDRLELLASYGPKVRQNATRKIKKGDSYYEFTRTWMAGLSLQLNNSLNASRFIGGGRLMTSFNGDPNEQPGYNPVAASVQRRALNLMAKSLFDENSFKISSSDLKRLTFNPKSPGNETFGRSRMFPVQQTISSAQKIGLSRLLSGDVLTRMQGNEFRSGGNTLTMAEMFRTLDQTIWSEVDTAKPVGSLRRELQRAYLDNMIPMALGQVRGAPNDAKDLAMARLVSLKHRIAMDMPKATDDYTKAHLSQSLARIDRAMAAQTVVPVGQ